MVISSWNLWRCLAKLPNLCNGLLLLLRFDPVRDVKVRVQPVPSTMPSLSHSRPPTEHVNIHVPIDIELSDKLLHKLLRSSGTQHEKLGSIHRVARKRRLKNKVPKLNQCTYTVCSRYRYTSGAQEPSGCVNGHRVTQAKYYTLHLLQSFNSI